MKFTTKRAIWPIALLLVASVCTPANAGEQSGVVACGGGGNFTWISMGQNWDLIGADNCKGSVAIPEGAKTINSVLHGSAITSITLPSTVTKIGEDAFADTKLTSFIVPDQVTEIGDRAFAGTPMTEIDIPGNIKMLGEDVFSGSSLETANISAGVCGISATTFRGAKSLLSINVAADNTDFSSDSGVLFDKNMDTLITYPIGKTDQNYAIANSVTDIGSYSFAYQSALETLTIPSTVTHIGEGAFLYASKLKNYTIPSGATPEKNAFRGTGVVYHDRRIACSKGGSVETSLDTIKLVWPTRLGNNPSPAQIARWEAATCHGTVKIPSEITQIPEYAFHATRLSTLVIPNTVTDIGASAFESSRLTSVTLPTGLKTISDGMFIQSTQLKTVQIPNTVTSIGANAFAYTDALQSLVIPGSVQSIGNEAFFGATSLKKINIPRGITIINDSTFGYTSSLDKLSIPNSVRTIGKRAFIGTGVSSIALPSGVADIDEYAFACIGNSITVTVPRTVVRLAANAFSTVSCQNKTKGSANVFLLGNAPDVIGTAKQTLTIHVQRGATGFNLDPVKHTWHGFKIAYGSPPK